MNKIYAAFFTLVFTTCSLIGMYHKTWQKRSLTCKKVMQLVDKDCSRIGNSRFYVLSMQDSDNEGMQIRTLNFWSYYFPLSLLCSGTAKILKHNLEWESSATKMHYKKTSANTHYMRLDPSCEIVEGFISTISKRGYGVYTVSVKNLVKLCVDWVNRMAMGITKESELFQRGYLSDGIPAYSCMLYTIHLNTHSKILYLHQKRELDINIDLSSISEICFSKHAEGAFIVTRDGGIYYLNPPHNHPLEKFYLFDYGKDLEFQYGF